MSCNLANLTLFYINTYVIYNMYCIYITIYMTDNIIYIFCIVMQISEFVHTYTYIYVYNVIYMWVVYVYMHSVFLKQNVNIWIKERFMNKWNKIMGCNLIICMCVYLFTRFFSGKKLMQYSEKLKIIYSFTKNTKIPVKWTHKIVKTIQVLQELYNSSLKHNT